MGHSSTSIGAALGMAIAARREGQGRKVVAVIGDGALTAGMAFEALNHAGDLHEDLLVVLNDNEMSISENRITSYNVCYTKLLVASPDWRDQVIYFLMIDRFNDGDPSNNDQGANEYDPTSDAKFSGGDLAGVEQKLDYIQGLGASAVWITPPVANRNNFV